MAGYGSVLLVLGGLDKPKELANIFYLQVGML